MKDIKDKIEQYYEEITNLFNTENESPKLLHRKNVLKKKKDEELITGIIVVSLIILIILSLAYYFLIFMPQQEQLDNLKQEKINKVNTLLPDDEEHNKEAIIAEIERKNTREDLENLDVDAMIHPILKNKLLKDIKEYKDKYNRVEIHTDNTTDIMNTDNATSYINTCDVDTLSTVSVTQVDSVIIPLSINRKQAASGLVTEGDVVDIYKTSSQIQESSTEELDKNQTTTSTQSSSSKVVGGSCVVSILRSKDSGSVEQTTEISQMPKSRNYLQTSSLDLEQIMSSKAAGVYSEKELKISLEDYGSRLANYERTSNIGELDAEYIIMLEVPRDSVEDLIDNMDNIILTIPTYDAPSWVNL